MRPLRQLHDCKVLIRAHGEPPETYQIALQNNIELIDASCPVVLKLQNRVRSSYEEVVANNGQGRHLRRDRTCRSERPGWANRREALIIRNEDDPSKIDFSRPIYFFSQTTKSSRGFETHEGVD